MNSIIKGDDAQSICGEIRIFDFDKMYFALKNEIQCDKMNTNIKAKKQGGIHMTELETMQRAKMYLDKLAQGIDPITNQDVPEDSVLNHVRLARCFFYVSSVLDQVIANGGVIGQRVKTMDFVITPEQMDRVQIQDYPVRITEFTEAVYQAIQNSEMKKPGVKKITDWLLAQGLMIQITGSDGKSHRIPTEQGLRMGMSTRLRQTRDGEYQAVYYDKSMQRYLLDNLMDVFSEK